MTFNYRSSRIAKIIVDTGNSSFPAVQKFLESQTLEVIIGDDATSPAAHAAILTAVATSSRSFLGGVRISGAATQSLNCRLPFMDETIGAAATSLGATGFEGEPAGRICIGTPQSPISHATHVWWHNWSAGISPRPRKSPWSNNPLIGIAAGALAVADAFEAGRIGTSGCATTVDLWPVVDGARPPAFDEVYLPDGLWLFGLGNLGQAFLWSLTALPYGTDKRPTVYLQDFDRISEENWGTSILVDDSCLGVLKTKIAEDWALRRGFVVHRVDRKLASGDHRLCDEPSIAICGFDNSDARLLLGNAGFPVIIDAGLGRKAQNFDEFRVTIFDEHYTPASYLSTPPAKISRPAIPDGSAYKELEDQIGECGAAQIAGASVAVPHVSAIAGAVAISRAIAIVSGRPIFRAEVRKLTQTSSKLRTPIKIESRELLHAGRPVLIK